MAFDPSFTHINIGAKHPRDNSSPRSPSPLPAGKYRILNDQAVLPVTAAAQSVFNLPNSTPLLVPYGLAPLALSLVMNGPHEVSESRKSVLAPLIEPLRTPLKGHAYLYDANTDDFGVIHETVLFARNVEAPDLAKHGVAEPSATVSLATIQDCATGNIVQDMQQIGKIEGFSVKPRKSCDSSLRSDAYQDCYSELCFEQLLFCS